MARIRYLAILMRGPGRACRLLCAPISGLTELGRSRCRRRDAHRRRVQSHAVPQSAGAARTAQGNRPPPPRHRGRERRRVVARYRACYPRGMVDRLRRGGIHHGEVRIYDPECNPVSSVADRFRRAGIGIARAAHRAHRAQRARHRERSSTSTRRCSASASCSAAHAGVAQGTRLSQQARRRRPLQRGDPGLLQRRGRPRAALRHRPFRLPGAGLQGDGGAGAAGGATVKARPARRTQSEIRMRDPEGNGCDLSQRGWEVDTDKWVRADAA